MHTDGRCGIEVPHRSIKRYDGQMVWLDGEDGASHELGNYLGGGAAGVVYESINLKSYEHVAMKVLNPIGYKMTPTSTIQRCTVVKKGSPAEPAVFDGDKKMSLENVWWVRHPSTLEVLGAYCDRHGKLRGLPLRRCIEIWGWNPKSCGTTNTPSHATLNNAQNSRFLYPRATDSGMRRHERRTKVPEHDLASPPNQYMKFVKNRQCIFKEICNMSKLNGHQNVLQLIEVLEYVQDSKSTIFLALELAAGGELFDRITIDRGTEEDTARQYYRQLLCGIQYCHLRGVCHRDLKPENLLLADNEDHPVLKIADFGLSALFRNGVLPSEAEQSIRRLRSVVGSPHYVAPEILTDNREGYEGAKADMWSSGVILYAMLAGNLPFGKEILQCPRFIKWNEWSCQRRLVQGSGNCVASHQQHQLPQRRRQQRYPVVVSRAGWSEQWQQWQQQGGGIGSSRVPYPTWFFPNHFSLTARQLLTELLDPDPDARISVQEALQHMWLQPGGEPEGVPTKDDESSSGAKLPCGDHESPQGEDGATSTSSSSSSSSSSSVTVVQTSGSPSQSVVASSKIIAAAALQDSVAQDRTDALSAESAAAAPEAATVSAASNSNQAAPVRDDAQGIIIMRGSDGARPPAAKIAHDNTNDLDRMQQQQQPMSAMPLQPQQQSQELRERETKEAEGPVCVPSMRANVVPCQDSTVSPSVTPNTTPRRRRKRSTLSFSSPPLAPMASRGALQPDAFALDSNSCSSGPSSGVQPSMGSLLVMGNSAAAASAPTSPHRSVTDSSASLRKGAAIGDVSAGLQALEVAVPPAGGGATCAEVPQMGEGAAGSGGDGRSSRLEMLPLFKDLVKRSTRFSTAVPASEVLHKIAHIIEQEPHPLPYPFRHITQRVTPDWNAYKLEVTRGGVRVCTVRVFQLRAGLYMVEFLRGQMDTFQFKRFYEHIRLELSEVVKNDYTLQLLDAHSPHSHRLRRGHLERSQSC